MSEFILTHKFEYEFTNISNILSTYAEKITRFNNLNSSAFETLKIEISDCQAYEDEIAKLKEEAKKLLNYSHSNFKNFLENKTKSFEDEIEQNNSGDFSKIDEKNIGYYNYKNEIVYFGEFTDGFYKSGILMRKEGKYENIYWGNFELVDNVQKFDGLYLPEKEGLIIYGTFMNDEITNGVIINVKDYNIEQIYKGKLINNKKVGDNISIRFDDNAFFSEGTDSYTFFPKKQLAHKGIVVFRLLNDNIYLKHDEKDFLYYHNSSIYVGPVDENYNRKGEGEYHICNDKIRITGYFDIDNINNAKVTNDSNFVVFDGKFVDNKMAEGTFHFSDKERFEGTFENGRKKNGKYFYANGTTYEGEWTDDRKIGKGIYTNEKGENKEITY